MPPPPPKLLEHGVEVRDEQRLRQGELDEPLELVGLDQYHPGAMKIIGTQMEPKIKRQLKELQIEHMDVFMWSPEDMPDIDTKITEHHLCVNPEAKKVPQK